MFLHIYRFLSLLLEMIPAEKSITTIFMNEALSLFYLIIGVDIDFV